jgi:flagellar basal body-associated protein FliL
VAFEVADDKYRDDLRAREVELRDVVISTLERHTLEELARPGARDSVRAELAAAVAPMVGEGGALRVFLPQFVIQ